MPDKYHVYNVELMHITGWLQFEAVDTVIIGLLFPKHEGEAKCLFCHEFNARVILTFSYSDL